jgi:hypothetical protein
MPDAVKGVLKSIGYIALFNLYYSDELINTTGFDGTICAPAVVECINYTTSPITTSLPGDNSFQNVPRNSVVWPESINAQTFDQFGFVYSARVIRMEDLSLWRITAIQGSFRMAIFQGSTASNVWLNANGDPFYTLPNGTTGIYLDDYNRGGPFEVQICIPAPS